MYTTLLIIQIALVVVSLITIVLIKKPTTAKQRKVRDWITLAGLVGTYAILCVNLFFIDPKGEFVPSSSYALSFFNFILCIFILFLVNLQTLDRRYKQQLNQVRAKAQSK